MTASPCRVRSRSNSAAPAGVKECAHTAPYRLAVRVTKDGAITIRKLGTCANRNVIATWCQRCGAIDIVDAKNKLLRYYPIARVIEDLT